MSKRKPKTATIWFRFTFLDTTPARARVMRAADKLFAVSGVEERRTYSEEDVVRMVATALEQAALMPGGQQAKPALGLSSDLSDPPTDKTSPARKQSATPRADEADPLAGEEFEEP